MEDCFLMQNAKSSADVLETIFCVLTLMKRNWLNANITCLIRADELIETWSHVPPDFYLPIVLPVDDQFGSSVMKTV